MKKWMTLLLAAVLVFALAGCQSVTKLDIQDPAKILVTPESTGIGVAVTDPETVRAMTKIVNALPLQVLESPYESISNYQVQWLDGDGNEICAIAVSGVQILYRGTYYTVGPGLDLSGLMDFLDSLPEIHVSIETKGQ